jgi:hypothetical protein
VVGLANIADLTRERVARGVRGVTSAHEC